MMQLTIHQWLRANGYDPAQAGLSVEIVGLWMPPELWDSVTFVHNESDIELVINT